MTQFPFILFNKSPEQLRRQGARGGKTYGRNLRARRALTPPAPTAVSQGVEVRETAAAAIQVLDAQFPWLRGAEKATPRGLVARSGNRRSLLTSRPVPGYTASGRP